MMIRHTKLVVASTLTVLLTACSAQSGNDRKAAAPAAQPATPPAVLKLRLRWLRQLRRPSRPSPSSRSGRSRDDSSDSDGKRRGTGGCARRDERARSSSGNAVSRRPFRA